VGVESLVDFVIADGANVAPKLRTFESRTIDHHVVDAISGRVMAGAKSRCRGSALVFRLPPLHPNCRSLVFCVGVGVGVGDDALHGVARRGCNNVVSPSAAGGGPMAHAHRERGQIDHHESLSFSVPAFEKSECGCSEMAKI
jgi:hypothetical protein